MRARFICCDDREREVVRLWKSSHLSPGSILLYLQWARRFRAYCNRCDLDEISHLTLDRVVRFADAYVGPRKRVVAVSSRHAARNALHAWACALRALKVPVPQWRQKPPSTQLTPLLVAYCRHRQFHNGTTKGTLRRDTETANVFLSFLRSRRKAASRATVMDLDAFVAQLLTHMSRRTAATICSSLRSFLRFLQITGRLRRDLAARVISPRVGIAEQPPRALPWNQVRRILHSISLTRPPGKRDFAMLLLMATYGLGAAEVLGLSLEDVDWKSEVLRVRRTKTGMAIDLPLLPPVAKALIAYLHTERPRCAETRRVFLSTGMPHNPITRGAIRHRIRYYARQVGVTADVLGAHVFRHSHASRQIDSGANIKVVSDILGHRRPSSTSVYVRVALRRLRKVALPVPR
jgi:integrase/recombinase XerD